jgi:acyl-CoA synthetase (AMP-forming)/AMP-acid ligase II
VAAGADDDLKARLAHVLVEADFAGQSATPTPLPSVSGSDIAFLQYTSGTTGNPKGVMISHRAVCANTYGIARGMKQTSDDVGVSWLPLFHDMGLIGALLRAVCHPTPLHVMPPERFIVKPAGWLKLMSDVGGTLSPAPNFAYDLCTARAGELEGVRLDRWRVALNGSEPVHAPTLSRFFEKFGPLGFDPAAMMPVYGMAEATLAVTFSPVGQNVRALGLDRKSLEEDGRVVLSGEAAARLAISVGPPLAGTSVSVVDESGRVVPEGVVGEVRVSGPSVMDGYFRNETASAAVLSDGWLSTGDLGFVHGGSLYIAGRAKEMVIKGGRNLYPYDVERVVGELTGVRLGGVAAFGRVNEATGTDDLVVVAETSEKDPTVREALTRSIRGEVLAVLGVGVDDVRLWPVGGVPRTSSGKIRRKECKRLAAEASEAGEAGST